MGRRAIRYRMLILGNLVGILARGYTCAMSYCDLGLTFDLDFVKMFSTVIFEIYFLYDIFSL